MGYIWRFGSQGWLKAHWGLRTWESMGLDPQQGRVVYFYGSRSSIKWNDRV